MALNQAYIVDAIRSPTGRRKGGLGHIHGADLGAHVLKEIVQRNGIPDVDYDDIIFGCVDAIGPLAGDIARTAWLAAGLSDEVPGTTIDRQCGSSQQAVHFAAQAIMSGTIGRDCGWWCANYDPNPHRFCNDLSRVSGLF